MTPVNDPNTAGTTTLKILFSKLPSLSATEEVNVVLRCSKLHFNGNDAQGKRGGKSRTTSVAGGHLARLLSLRIYRRFEGLEAGSEVLV